MRSVLGIDAAWSDRGSSGVALVAEKPPGWRCVAVAPSYDSFLALADGQPVGWDHKHSGAFPDPGALLVACRKMLHGNAPTVIALDLPMATIPINGRRAADNAISKEFGGSGCSTHSPSPKRPGKLGESISNEFQSCGFPLATLNAKCGAPNALLEVYPHPAILALLGLSRRFEYKASNSKKYWRELSREARYAKLTSNLGCIFKELRSTIILGGEQFPFPPKCPPKVILSSLKPYEDALDAIVCAWVGIKYLEGVARPFGDDTSAIWVPD